MGNSCRKAKEEEIALQATQQDGADEPTLRNERRGSQRIQLLILSKMKMTVRSASDYFLFSFSTELKSPAIINYGCLRDVGQTGKSP
jgi:hypothetical protein